MRTLFLVLSLISAVASAEESVLVTKTHCQQVAVNNRAVAEQRDMGIPMELALATVVYAHVTLNEDSSLRKVTPFVYQWTPLIYKAHNWSPDQTLEQTYKACMVFEGKTVTIPEME